LQLKQHGQSVWIDYIRRDFVQNGDLQAYIDEDGVYGVTSNPAIFKQAIAESDLYDGALRALSDADVNQAYEALVVEDIQSACDVFLPVYEQTQGRDGFVSLEVSPRLAHQTQATIDEAKHLFKAVARPNVMIKVPATPEGIAAIEALIAVGLNINVTLIFSQTVYRQVCQAYIRGLEQRLERGKSISDVASVASVFVSRIDTLVDRLLAEKVADDVARKPLQGKLGVANLKLVYQIYKATFCGQPFAALKAAGAAVQRPLWASTSTKNPDYSDVLYVEPLIGAETVNTLPLSTLDAFRDHGRVEGTVEQDLEAAKAVINDIAAAGIDLPQVMAQLLTEGVDKFISPFEQLLESIAQKQRAMASK